MVSGLRTFFLLILFFNAFEIYGRVITWIPDVIQVNESFTHSGSSSQYLLSVLSNGPIFRHSYGNFRFNISITLAPQFRPLHAITSCIGVYDHADSIAKAMSETVLGEYPLLPGDDQLLGNFLDTQVTKTFNDFNSTTSALYSFTVQMQQKRSFTSMAMTYSVQNCFPLKTSGQWSDENRWDLGSVPNITDKVVIPANAGAIFVTSNVTVMDLEVSGGELHLSNSACPSGWTADDRLYNTGKCYRLFDVSMNYSSAEEVCNRQVGGGGSDDRHLMHISDAEENDLALRLCRGESGVSDAANKGCWIGLQRPSQPAAPQQQQNSDFAWLSASAVGASVTGTKRNAFFLDFRRSEPNNMTVSNGSASFEGEACVHLVKWQTDPLILEQGAWADDACQNTRPFLCQVFAPTTRVSVTVLNSSELVSAQVHGGVLWLLGPATITTLHLLSSASLYLANTNHNNNNNNLKSFSRIKDISLMDASKMVVMSRVFVYSGGHIGDMAETTFRYLAGINYDNNNNDNNNNNEHNALLHSTNLRSQHAQSLVLITNTGSLSTTSVSDVTLMPSSTASSATTSTATSASSSSSGNCVLRDKTTVLQNNQNNSLLIDSNSNSNSNSNNNENMVTVEARLVVRGGNVTVDTCTALLLKQGGDLSKANVALLSSTSYLSLDGYASKLSSFDSFNVHSSNRGPFIGEFYDGDIAAEFNNLRNGVSRGVYRLAVRRSSVSSTSASVTSNTNTVGVTACVGYNASASDLQTLLNQLTVVQSFGGVSVRRYGDSNLTSASRAALFRYGYSYRVDFDAPHTTDFYLGSLSLSVFCYGSRQKDCGCAQTKVPLQDASGTRGCETAANVSTIDPDACVHAPALSVERVSTLSFVASRGLGQVTYTAGVHRLPPVTAASSHVTIAGTATGVGVVAADHILWQDLALAGKAQLFVAGTRWAGWDSVFHLFAPDWDNERGLEALHRAPACSFALSHFALYDLAGVFSTGPASNFTWRSGEWNGGVLGGRSHLSVTEQVTLNGSNRALRDVFTLTIESSATLTWLAGNISLANAATIVNEGVFVIGNRGNTASAGTGAGGSGGSSSGSGSDHPYFPFAMGEADYLNDSSSSSSSNSNSNSNNQGVFDLLQVHPGRSWQSYFSSDLVAELRTGWYLNPFCGSDCGNTNVFILRGQGELRADQASQTTFVLPVYLLDQSRFNVFVGAVVNFASGGTFGNEVVVTLGEAARLELSGGRMSLQATCTIQGSGDLQVTGGAHDLSFIIDARITISGGRLTWPQTRGEGSTITFRGGLIIESSGQLIVEPQSTVIQVESDVLFKDNCLIQFPVLGIAAQSTPFDGPDFPDTSPRCTLNATRILRWEGGTIAGKVDIISRSFLYLDGSTKRVESLAKLLNYGHCEWGAGDLVIENQGDFVNYGSIQMMLGQAKFDANVVYRGTALPVTNGGDPFAKVFHTYDLDPGGLNYAEYVQLNGEYVSILPGGWTAADQIAGFGQGGLSSSGH